MSESASLPTRARPTEVWPMRLLLLAACVGIVGVFPLHAFGTPHGLGFRAFALALAVSGITGSAANATTILYNDFSSLAGLQVNGVTKSIHGCAGSGDGSTCGAVPGPTSAARRPRC